MRVEAEIQLRCKNCNRSVNLAQDGWTANEAEVVPCGCIINDNALKSEIERLEEIIRNAVSGLESWVSAEDVERVFNQLQATWK